MRNAICCLLSFVACFAACRRTERCPGRICPSFPESYRSLIPTDSGETLTYTDGIQTIRFRTAESRAVAGQYQPPYQTDRGTPCDSMPRCSAQAYWAANAPGTATHPAIGFEYYASFGDTSLKQYSTFDNGISLWWTPNGPNNYFRYYPVLGDSAHFDHVLRNFRLGNKTYDRVVVLTADTLQRPAPDVWRVYFANPGGIVGFESLYTHTTFHRE